MRNRERKKKKKRTCKQYKGNFKTRIRAPSPQNTRKDVPKRKRS